MKIIKNTLTFVTVTAFTLLITGCMDEVTPVSTVTPEDVEGMSNTQEALLNGIVAFTNDLNTWGATGDEAYYLNDWGYPCQMYLRDVLTADFPVASSSYNYWINMENSSDLRYAPYYTYNYYYRFIKKCNSLAELIDPKTATSSSKNYLGCALVFRAMCYLDMARLFEYRETGYEDLDAKAKENGVLDLTVPIVTEKTTEEECKNNPRVPFYTMYRFILTDLNNAVEYLEGYSRSNGTFPDQSVAYGMLARLWLEMATRFNLEEGDLNLQLAVEGSTDGYDDLGITTVKECYEKASQYAQLAEIGYVPMTQSEWTAANTGFNTATEAWMFFSRVSTQEQEGLYYSNFLGTICTEAAWGMPQYGPYRLISKSLYNKMGNGDIRKLAWISPDDAGKTPNAENGLASKYQLASWSKTDETDETKTITQSDKFAEYPAYANLKFRTRDNTNYINGMMCDLPLMRVEEMYFIDAEATAHIDDTAAGVQKLQEFMNSYRYTDGSYKCTATDIDAFNTELIAQKRIEFWGEGLSLFDYKRLKLRVNRSGAGNYLDAYEQDSKQGYVSPSMNYYILTYAFDTNKALKANPDCSKWYEK